MTALFESFSLTITLDVFPLSILTLLPLSRVGKPVLDSEYVFGLEPDIVFHIDPDFVRPVYAVSSALAIETHPSCLLGTAVKLGIGWVMDPDSLSPLVGYHK